MTHRNTLCWFNRYSNIFSAFGSSMYPIFMLVSSCSIVKTFSTFITTFIRLGISMCVFMFLKSCFLSKSFITNATLILSLVFWDVDRIDVVSQFSICTELFVTLGTLKQFVFPIWAKFSLVITTSHIIFKLLITGTALEFQFTEMAFSVIP